MTANKAQWFILVLVNIPVFLGLGRLIFKEWDGFFEAIRLWSNLDWLLTLQKEWREDRWGTAKLPVFVVLCIGLVISEHLMFSGAKVKSAAQLVGML